MKIHPVGAGLFHADRHVKVNSRYWQFCARQMKSTNKPCGRNADQPKGLQSYDSWHA